MKKICVATISIGINGITRYWETAKKLVLTNLEHTPFDILLITDNVLYFDDIKNDRLKILYYFDLFSEKTISDSRFNMHLKRYPIQVASEYGYGIIFYNDCDCFINGWDNESFLRKCEDDFDIAFVSHANPQLGDLRKNYKHFQDKIDNEFGDLYYGELDNSPNPAETRVIIKNNEKLKTFLSFWDSISKRNKDYFTYFDSVYFGTSATHSKMKMIGVTPSDNFSKNCFISHGDGILNYFGERLL